MAKQPTSFAIQFNVPSSNDLVQTVSSASLSSIGFASVESLPLARSVQTLIPDLSASARARELRKVARFARDDTRPNGREKGLIDFLRAPNVEF
jgi:hypothetical protein